MRQNMILLHGLFGQLSNWDKVIEHFGTSYNIHVPVLPIFNTFQSDHLHHLTEFLETYIHHHQLKDLTLVGNSLGGHIAILYTSLHGENVKGLVLTGSSGLYENTNIGGFPRRGTYHYIKQRVAYTFHDPAMATEELVSEVLKITTNRDMCLSTIRIAKSTQRNYVASLLPAISTPTLLIWGKEDRITPLTVAHEFENMLPNARLVVFEDCGHVPMMEKPVEFNETLASYLSAQSCN